MYTRRQFGSLALAAVPVSLALGGPRVRSVINGVHVGVQTYSYREFPANDTAEANFEAVIKAMRETGLGECEVWGPHAFPGTLHPARRTAETRKTLEEDSRKWHLAVPLDHFKRIRKQCVDGGIELYGYNGGRFGSDEEIDRSFLQAKALGAKVLTTSGTLSQAAKIARFAEKHKIPVAMHGHSNVTDPDQFATPESFTKALAMSKYFMVNLDLGHFAAAGFDPVAFLKEHHDRTPLIHVKDRRKNQGPNTPFGEGDTPIREVLRLIRDNRWEIRAYIEYEYRGTAGAVAEVQKCFDYIKSALA